MEVILLWKKTKKYYGLLIFPNIITEKWGLGQVVLDRVRFDTVSKHFLLI